MRQIERDLPERIIRQPERVFRDVATGYQVAVASVSYRAGGHLMMVVYEELAEEIIAVTIPPLDQRDLNRKLQSGRWTP